MAFIWLIDPFSLVVNRGLSLYFSEAQLSFRQKKKIHKNRCWLGFLMQMQKWTNIALLLYNKIWHFDLNPLIDELYCRFTWSLIKRFAMFTVLALIFVSEAPGHTELSHSRCYYIRYSCYKSYLQYGQHKWFSLSRACCPVQQMHTTNKIAQTHAQHLSFDQINLTDVIHLCPFTAMH